MREAWGLEKFSIGLAFGGGGDAAQWQRDLERAERADQLGFHSLWVPEMHFSAGGCSSPLIALHALAARTRRARVATTSLLLPIHDAVALASEIATLDRHSGGRLLVGLGRGFRAPLFDAFGVDPSTKRDRFDAALGVMRARWRSLANELVQRPHPPLAVAAFGPKGIRQAARHGLPYLPSMIETLEALERNYQSHAGHLPAGIDRASLVVPAMRTLHVAGSDAEAERVLEQLEAWTRQRLRDVPQVLARGTQGPAADRAIVGTTNEVVDRIELYRERIGLDLLIATAAGPEMDERERNASMERLATKVRPQLG